MSALQSQGDDYLAIDVRVTQYSAKDGPLFVPGLPSLVPSQNITRMAHWPWLLLMYSSPHYRLYKVDYNAYYVWYPFHAKDQ